MDDGKGKESSWFRTRPSALNPWEEVPQREEDQRRQGAIFGVESTAELSVADTATNNTEPTVCTQGNWE